MEFGRNSREDEKERMSMISSTYLDKYLNPKKSKAKFEKAVEILKKLKFDSIAFCGVSGALIAPVLAHALNKKLIVVRKNNQKSHSYLKVEGNYSSKTYVIADDFVTTGRTVKTIKREIKKEIPNAQCIGVLEMEYIDGKTSVRNFKLTEV